MKITAGLGVKDEVELIDRALAHLFEIGVDHIVVLDMGSTDGTLDILDAYAQRRDFTLLRGDDSIPGAFDRWLAESLVAIKASDADWTLFLDADEFWLPASGSIRDSVARARHDVLSVSRFNVPAGPSGALLPDRLDRGRYGEIMLVVEPIPNFKRHLAKNPDTPWLRGVPNPKVLARTAGIGAIAVHAVITPDGHRVPGEPLDDIVIAHVPFSTATRFARKLANARKVIERHDKSIGAWHWRRWSDASSAADAEALFAREVFDDRSLTGYRASGVIRSAAEIFAARGVTVSD